MHLGHKVNRQNEQAKKLIMVTLARWLQLDIPKCLPHDLRHRWPLLVHTRESMGERDTPPM
jgi:hypothetical protein